MEGSRVVGLPPAMDVRIIGKGRLRSPSGFAEAKFSYKLVSTQQESVILGWT